MKLSLALRQLHDAETDLGDEYRKVADRHRVEHDLFHMCHTLAKQTDGHAERLIPYAEQYGTRLVDSDASELWQTMLGAIRRKNAELVGKTKAAGLLLLRDLRQLYLMARESDIDWIMLGQGAQAARDAELLELVRVCHEETCTQLAWITTRIKEASPQVLVG